MAKKKDDSTTKRVRVTRRMPATMLQDADDQRDYYGEDVERGATRTLPAAVADRLVKAGHAEEL